MPHRAVLLVSKDNRNLPRTRPPNPSRRQRFSHADPAEPPRQPGGGNGVQHGTRSSWARDRWNLTLPDVQARATAVLEIPRRSLRPDRATFRSIYGVPRRRGRLREHGGRVVGRSREPSGVASVHDDDSSSISRQREHPSTRHRPQSVVPCGVHVASAARVTLFRR